MENTTDQITKQKAKVVFKYILGLRSCEMCPCNISHKRFMILYNGLYIWEFVTDSRLFNALFNKQNTDNI